MRNFTDIKDISRSDIDQIIRRTREEKKLIKDQGILSIEKILMGKNF